MFGLAAVVGAVVGEVYEKAAWYFMESQPDDDEFKIKMTQERIPLVVKADVAEASFLRGRVCRGPWTFPILLIGPRSCLV